jgi:transcriptional regulator with XRE-family HTH domain
MAARDAASPQPTRIGTALRRARERKRKSLQRAAHDAGIAASVLSRIESGVVKDVKLTTFATLAKVLDFSLDDLAAEAGLLPRGKGRRLAPLGLTADDLAPLADALAEASRRLDALERRAPKSR